MIRPSVVSSTDDDQTEPESDDDKTEPEILYSERVSPLSVSKGRSEINVSHDEVAVSGLIILVSGASV